MPASLVLRLVGWARLLRLRVLRAPSIRCAALVCVFSILVTPTGSAQRPPRPAVPLDPVDAIVKAYQSYRVVAFAEHHGSAPQHTFLRSLIRDSRFTDVVNDIVVEFGNTLYQDVIDRFVRGEPIPDASLQRVWNYTTAGIGVWGRQGMYEVFYREVRALNATLPPGRQLRVLLAEPAVDWERPDLGGFVRRRSGEGVTWPTNDERYDSNFHAVSVIRQEVLAKRRRALVIYGRGHVTRGGYQNIVGLLENRFSTKVFVLAAPTEHDLERVQPDIATWRIPSLAMVRGTRLGPLDVGFLLDARQRENSAEVYYDAMVYLGPSASLMSVHP